MKYKLKYTIGNSTVILDIQEPVANDSSDGVAIVIMSFQFKLGKKISTCDLSEMMEIIVYTNC